MAQSQARFTTELAKASSLQLPITLETINLTGAQNVPWPGGSTVDVSNKRNVVLTCKPTPWHLGRPGR
jgi:hypothetical protein